MIKKCFALTLISASLLAVGCSSDDDDEGDTTGGTTGGTTTGMETNLDAELTAGAEYDVTALEPVPTLNLAETAASVESLSTLVQTIGNSCPDINAALVNAESRLTVFAPTNDAFLAADVVAALSADGADACAVIAGHVIADAVASGDELQSQVGRVATTLAGTEVAIEQDASGNLTIGGAVVSGANNFATNGVAHIIASVILPAEEGGSDGTTDGTTDGTKDGTTDVKTDGTTGGTTGGGGELGASLTAVQAAGNSQFVELWQTASLGLALDDNPWTVFAPSNDAIDDGVFATVNADQTSAFNLLNGHIVTTGSLDATALDALSSITVNTGTEYAVGNDDGVITVNGFAVTAITTTGNATVYSIDGVLQ